MPKQNGFHGLCYVTLILFGLIQLPIQLVRAIKEVNLSDQAPDTSEWIVPGHAEAQRSR